MLPPSEETALRDLRTEGTVSSVRVEVRHVPLTPVFKLYPPPGTAALFGPYEVIERTSLLDDGTAVEVLDVLGPGSVLTRHVSDEGDPSSAGSVFVRSVQSWFDSCWDCRPLRCAGRGPADDRTDSPVRVNRVAAVRHKG
ncbi:hypothetical protein ABZ023_24440 [Streptomyces sp. NPDC006367]|uniref:hypothetical protein n=1 Tax=unclassified Streptomyces TaxID=2593676 RepID=UPI0033B172CD